jgi:CubicO group peptidase (beta-lactamase class C family)
LSDDYGYGFQWWIRNFQINQTSITSILAWGFGGQFILVFPDLKITVAITQGNYDSEELSIQVFDLLKNFILPQ